MFKQPTRGYSREMNDNLVPAEAEGYTFQFGISRTTLRIVGLCAVVAVTVLTVLINATEPFRIPLGITLGALAITLLVAYAVSSSDRREVRTERDFELTERELECLFWIAEGKTSDEIATILGISRNTINNYITSVMRKTGTKTRSEAIAYAVRHNLV